MQGPCGGIGRRGRLKIYYLLMWEFESPRGHHASLSYTNVNIFNPNEQNLAVNEDQLIRLLGKATQLLHLFPVSVAMFLLYLRWIVFRGIHQKRVFYLAA